MKCEVKDFQNRSSIIVLKRTRMKSIIYKDTLSSLKQWGGGVTIFRNVFIEICPNQA